MTELKRIRQDKQLTQKQVASFAGVSLRSYKMYENDGSRVNSTKYKYLLDRLKEINPIDEKHGLLTVEEIVRKCESVFKNHDVEYCYLYGSYAKSKATPSSDVNLLISSNLKGLRFYEMIEDLKEELHKRVDVINVEQLSNDFELTKTLLKDGIKIYDIK
ncbi:MAG: nucleotidyltransferase domain-containing protein [Holdemanella sp.]|nr:nucleotidyltransferase domain-containing protein [Holdemanella sp.]